MIDMLSGGRLVYGFVRGIDLLGQEVIPALKVYQAPGEGALATGTHLRNGGMVGIHVISGHSGERPKI